MPKWALRHLLHGTPGETEPGLVESRGYLGGWKADAANGSSRSRCDAGAGGVMRIDNGDSRFDVTRWGKGGCAKEMGRERQACALFVLKFDATRCMVPSQTRPGAIAAKMRGATVQRLTQGRDDSSRRGCVHQDDQGATCFASKVVYAADRCDYGTIERANKQQEVRNRSDQETGMLTPGELEERGW